MNIETKIKTAIARSISHTEIVHVEVDELEAAYLADGTPTSNRMNIPQFIGYIKQSRKYGSTYVHVRFRNNFSRFDVFPEAEHGGRKVKLSFCGYGRSLQSGGHKYKAHAYYRDTGKPVPSKKLNEIT